MRASAEENVWRMRAMANAAPMLDAATEDDCLRRIQESDDPAAMRTLLASHLRMVLSMAYRYKGHGISIDDLVAEGNLGLVEAARRFDREKGVRFATYAAWWTRALIRRFALANRRVIGSPSTRNARKLWSSLRPTERRLTAALGAPPTHEQMATELSVTVEEIEMVEAALTARDAVLSPTDGGLELADDGCSPEDQVAEHQHRALTGRAIDRALAMLDVRERNIVEKRLLSQTDFTLAEIGRSMGLSRERVRQIEARACEKLREALLAHVA
jgi:RNA polymerase sigma-32 factor